MGFSGLSILSVLVGMKQTELSYVVMCIIENVFENAHEFVILKNLPSSNLQQKTHFKTSENGKSLYCQCPLIGRESSNTKKMFCPFLCTVHVDIE